MSDAVDARDHWRATWERTPEDALSWFQAEPVSTIELVRELEPDLDAAIIDVGGGASRLVDGLLTSGYRDLTVLDIAKPALDIARSRLGADASRVAWIVGDVLTHEFDRQYDVWHDRAVFHFLTSAEGREAYRARLGASVRSGGVVIMATFAPDGPDRCSGLPVCRYTSDALVHELGPGFEAARALAELHRTPGGADQAFTVVVARRVG